MTLLLALVLLAQVTPAPAAAPDEADRLFQLGNRLSAEGDWAGAAAAYEGALATGWTSAALHLNLSTAHAEAGRLGSAVLHAERAARIDPGDEAVQHNLLLLRARVGDGASERARSPLTAVVRRLAGLGAVPLVAVAFVLWTLALGLAAWRVWTRQPQPWARRALVVLVPVVLIAGMAAVAVAHHEALPRAVVLAAAADVQATPTTASAVRAVLTEGRVVPVGARRGAWVEVRLPDGTAGWATAGAIEEI